MDAGYVYSWMGLGDLKAMGRVAGRGEVTRDDAAKIASASRVPVVPRLTLLSPQILTNGPTPYSEISFQNMIHLSYTIASCTSTQSISSLARNEWS